MNIDNFLPTGLADQTVTLEPIDGLPKSAHVFERDSILAVNTALACGRPLLVKGEPGCGKSQLARAVAQTLGRRFLAKYVDARTEAHDLLWSHDAVTRLADAQTLRASGDGDESTAEKLARRKYVIPGPLWWALNWTNAKEHVNAAVVKPSKTPGEKRPSKGMVVLIDEIDKADSSVPNGLLESLGQQTFTVPGIDEPIHAEGSAPLVLLTSNGDRTLPPAFVRRCVVLHLRLPNTNLDRWLVARGKAHFGGDLSEEWLRKAARQVARDREEVASMGVCAPGLAEYIDLLTALRNGVAADAKDPIEAIATFVLRKYADPGEAPK